MSTDDERGRRLSAAEKRIAELEATLAEMSRTRHEVREYRQRRAFEWALRCFGAEATDLRIRAARVLEEAVELAQSSRVSELDAARILTRCYSRPAGDARAEAGNLTLTLLVWFAAAGVSAERYEAAELQRVEFHPDSYWTERNARKREQGLP